jgi:hypothetical protein
VLPDMFPGFDQIGPTIDLVDQRMDFPVPLLSSSSSANAKMPTTIRLVPTSSTRSFATTYR